MTNAQKVFFVALRVALGALFLYAGVTKVIDPTWSAAGYISGAKNFTGFYQLLLDPGILPIVNLLNAWGLTLLGVSLISGLLVRLSSVLGAVLMLLYYFALPFPQPDAHSLIVDNHIIYALILCFFAATPASSGWGLGGKIFGTKKDYPA